MRTSEQLAAIDGGSRNHRKVIYLLLLTLIVNDSHSVRSLSYLVSIHTLLLIRKMSPKSFEKKTNPIVPENAKVIALVFYGRREFVKILDRYLQVHDTIFQ
jgi:hypothetical protein